MGRLAAVRLTAVPLPLLTAGVASLPQDRCLLPFNHRWVGSVRNGGESAIGGLTGHSLMDLSLRSSLFLCALSTALLFLICRSFAAATLVKTYPWTFTHVGGDINELL